MVKVRAIPHFSRQTANYSRHIAKLATQTRYPHRLNEMSVALLELTKE